MSRDKPVLFYGHRSGKYRSFSNWYNRSFIYKGITWATSEHALMSEKNPKDKKYQKKLIKSTDPGEAKRLGRKVKLRPDWDKVKLNIMIDILYAKFSQNPDLAKLLLDTGNRPIHENCRDKWWGGGPNFPGGRDFLGIALKAVRKKLKKESKKK